MSIRPVPSEAELGIGSRARMQTLRLAAMKGWAHDDANEWERGLELMDSLQTAVIAADQKIVKKSGSAMPLPLLSTA